METHTAEGTIVYVVEEVDGNESFAPSRAFTKKEDAISEAAEMIRGWIRDNVKAGDETGEMRHLPDAELVTAWQGGVMINHWVEVHAIPVI